MWFILSVTDHQLQAVQLHWFPLRFGGAFEDLSVRTFFKLKLRRFTFHLGVARYRLSRDAS